MQYEKPSIYSGADTIVSVHSLDDLLWIYICKVCCINKIIQGHCLCYGLHECWFCILCRGFLFSAWIVVRVMWCLFTLYIMWLCPCLPSLGSFHRDIKCLTLLLIFPCRAKGFQHQRMTNGAMNVEIGNPAYKIYEGEPDDDAGELLDVDFTLDPDKVSE